MWNLVRASATRLSRSRRFSTVIPGPCIVHKRGTDILHDPWFNKVISSSSCFPLLIITVGGCFSRSFLYDFSLIKLGCRLSQILVVIPK